MILDKVTNKFNSRKLIPVKDIFDYLDSRQISNNLIHYNMSVQGKGSSSDIEDLKEQHKHQQMFSDWAEQNELKESVAIVENLIKTTNNALIVKMPVRKNKKPRGVYGD